MHDIVIIGGGPAGMTAALYAQRNGKSSIVLEKHGFGGQITYSPKVENYPGTQQMSGNEFADHFLEQIIAQGAEVELEKAISIEIKDDGKKVVHTEEGGEYECHAIVIATGVKHRMLGLEGENELVGNGISFCAVCDGDFYAGQTVCVAGGGNSALQEAILLTAKCKEVIMLQDLPEFTGEKRLQEILLSRPNVRTYTNTKITALQKNGEELSGVEIQNKTSGEKEVISCQGLFVAIGLIPQNEAFKDYADLNSYGYFDSSESCCTKTDGIFVAGDCRSKTVRQVTTACADGSTAALAACKYIDTL